MPGGAGETVPLRHDIVARVQRLSQTVEVSIIGEEIAELLRTYYGVDRYAVVLVSQDRETIVCAAASGEGLPLVGARVALREHGWAYRALFQGLQARSDGLESAVLKALGVDAGRNQRQWLPITYAGDWIGCLVVDALAIPENCQSEFDWVLQSLGTALFHGWIIHSIRDLVIKDDVSGLYNSRFLHDALEREFQRSQRYGSSFAIIFMDLDYFKTVNDTHGHRIGTAVLRETGALLAEALRESDLAIRYGGDEFVVILPETHKSDAIAVAKRIMKKIGARSYAQEQGLNLKLTASLGVAAYPDDSIDKLQLLEISDKAMYTVKGICRNGVATKEGVVR